MSKPPKGHHLKYFNNDETQYIRTATASVSDFHEKLSLNVSTDKKAIIIKSLGTLVHAKWDTETYGTWFDISGINNIKSALMKLKSDNLISEDYYNSIVKNFPMPGNGTINILEQNFPAHRLGGGLFKATTQSLPKKTGIEDEFVLVSAEDCNAEDTSKTDAPSSKCSFM